MFWKVLDEFCNISLLSNCSDLVGVLTCQQDARVGEECQGACVIKHLLCAGPAQHFTAVSSDGWHSSGKEG